MSRLSRAEDPRQFLDLAFGYYMAGRFAALNRLRIAPNLMHHAIELLIKYTLLKDVPEQQRTAETERIKERHGHRLNALWNQYKAQVIASDLVRFDPVINELHRWEELRYGGFPEGVDVTMLFGSNRPAGGTRATSRREKVYVFNLQEVDDLFTTMISAGHINPPFVGSTYRTTTLPEWYVQENQHSLTDLFEP